MQQRANFVIIRRGHCQINLDRCSDIARISMERTMMDIMDTIDEMDKTEIALHGADDREAEGVADARERPPLPAS